MGFLDGSIAGYFKTDAKGRELFFARGRFGRGRVVPNAEEGAALRLYLKTCMICVIVGAALIVPVADKLFGGRPAWAIILIAVATFAGMIPMWLKVRTWQLADERITYRESVDAAAKAHSTVSLSVLILLSGILLGACLFVFFGTEARVVGAFGSIFFGACLVAFLFMLRARRRG